MKYTNKMGLPQALCDAVMRDPYDSEGSWRTVTQLIAPPRVIRLKELHEDEITVDVSDCLYSLYGQIVHQILERSNTKDLVEERISAEVLGRKISGGFDVLQRQKGRLIDWKFSTVWKAVGEPSEWTAQLNLLALLFRKNGILINEAEINLLMRDHSKPKARREGDYPQWPVKRIPIPIWSDIEQECFLMERIEAHLAATDKLPLCTKEERWAKPTVYAVKKAGNKTAIRGGIFTDRKLAEEKRREDVRYIIQEREGENTRCEYYCLASPFCSQYKQMKEEKYESSY